MNEYRLDGRVNVENGRSWVVVGECGYQYIAHGREKSCVVGCCKPILNAQLFRAEYDRNKEKGQNDVLERSGRYI